MGIIVDPAGEELNTTAASEPAVVRYVAPELLDPMKAMTTLRNPQKESDVYSLAMTAYEVIFSPIPRVALLTDAPSPQLGPLG